MVCDGEATVPDELKARLYRIFDARLGIGGPMSPGGEASHATRDASPDVSIDTPPRDRFRKFCLMVFTKVALSEIFLVTTRFENEMPNDDVIPGGEVSTFELGVN